MYEKFYGLKEPPFNLTPDSRFLFMSQHHREAMAALLYGIRERKGFTLLTGEIGSGKTTLCRALVSELDGSGTQVALVLNSYLNETELLQTINEELAIDASAPTRKGLIDALNRHLVEQFQQGRHVAIVLDEAQNFADSVLEQIRLLGNLDTEQQKLLQVLLIGQPELQAALQSLKLEQLNQRIAVRYHLRALQPDEIEPYIHHRLRVAGLSVPLDFTARATRLLFELTGGIPRKINLLCDRALLAGYVASTRTIDDAILRTAAMDVGADQWTGVMQEALKPRARSAVVRTLSHKTLVYALAAVVVLAMIPILIHASGLWSRWFADAAPLNRKSAAALPEQIIPPEPPAEQAALRPAAPAPIPATFTPVAPKPAAPWSYDADRIVRVSLPEFCRTAATLTLLAAWGIDVNLQDFRRLTIADVQRLDLVAANRELGLRETEIKAGLARALAYDLPLVVEIADPEKRLSNHVVLLGMTADGCRVGDPVMGIQQVPRPLFESFWRRAWAVYFDGDNLESLLRGQRSDGVKALQQALSGLGFYQGTPSGEFDRATVTAVENLQRRFELFPTGRLDPLTVMLLTSHRHPDRPRLNLLKETAR